MVHRKVKKNGYPFKMTTRKWGVHKLAKEMRKRQLQQEILDLLYNVRTYKGEPAKDHEVLTVNIKQSKNDFFKFLKAHTRWGAVGSWINEQKKHKFEDEKNSVIQIEFLDTQSENIGRDLMKLLDRYNKEYVKEDLLYAWTVPVEESTLPLMEYRG
jgi:hypothetical protein